MESEWKGVRHACGDWRAYCWKKRLWEEGSSEHTEPGQDLVSDAGEGSFSGS